MFHQIKSNQKDDKVGEGVLYVRGFLGKTGCMDGRKEDRTKFRLGKINKIKEKATSKKNDSRNKNGKKKGP